MKVKVVVSSDYTKQCPLAYTVLIKKSSRHKARDHGEGKSFTPTQARQIAESLRLSGVNAVPALKRLED